MNELQVFANKEFGEVRTLSINGEPWFVGKDVAMILGYSEPRSAVSKKVDEEDRGVAKMETPSGIQDMTIINESGLYSLILSSKLPSAKKFKHWVTSEVLPSIRKTGKYSVQIDMPSYQITDPIERARKWIEEEQTRQKLLSENTVMKPKAEYFDELVDRNMLTSFRETAKEFGIKEKTFIQWLIDNRYVYRDKKCKLMPYADRNDGLFELKECNARNNSWSGTQTLITPKGRETFRLLCQYLKH